MRYSEHTLRLKVEWKLTLRPFCTCLVLISSCRVLRLIILLMCVPCPFPPIASTCARSHTHPHHIHMHTCTGTASGGRVVAETSVKTLALLRLRNISLVLRKAISGLFSSLFCVSVFILAVCGLNQTLTEEQRRSRCSREVSHWERRIANSFSFAFSSSALEKISVNLLWDSL